MQCLIVGANGLIGKRLGTELTARGVSWVGTYNKRPGAGLRKLDITDLAEVEGFFSEFSPEVVFHSANLAGGVNFCESNPKVARDFHLNATKTIGTECKATNATMVFMSTDYVFDGTKDSYREDDPPNPLNVYGKLKEEAEEWIRNNLDRYLIIRTTNVYGWDPETKTPNYMMGLYMALKDKRPFSAPSFLWGNPTYVGDLAEAIVELYTKKVCGLFHIVGNSFVNRLEWSKKASEVFGLDASSVNEMKEPPCGMVSRPLKSRLRTDKFTGSYKTTLHDLSGGLNLMKSDINKT